MKIPKAKLRFHQEKQNKRDNNTREIPKHDEDKIFRPQIDSNSVSENCHDQMPSV